MINAAELRIGNKIYNQGSGISRRVISVSGNIISELEKGRMKKLQPIPLTDKWLFNFGFSANLGDFILNENNYFFVVYHKLNKYFRHDGKEIRYVHELQNLYFVLTSKDLIIS